MAFEIPPADAEVFKQASRLETGGMRAFTSYMFADLAKKPRWDLVGVRIDLREERGFDKLTEYVPWVPLDWQFALAHATQMDSSVIGGMGSSKTVGAAVCGVYWCCLAPWSRIYDARSGKYITVEECSQRPVGPVVLSWTGEQFELVQAGVPEVMGKSDYVQVTLDDGREITVAPNHRFLTQQGWQYLSQLDVGDRIAVLPTQEKLPLIAHGLSDREIEPGCQESCLQDHRPHGELPRPWTSSDQGSPLPQGDVQGRTSHSWQPGGSAGKFQCIRPCQCAYLPSSGGAISRAFHALLSRASTLHSVMSLLTLVKQAASRFPLLEGGLSLPSFLSGLRIHRTMQPEQQTACSPVSALHCRFDSATTQVALQHSSIDRHIRQASDQASFSSEPFHFSQDYLPSASPSLAWCCIREIVVVGHGDYYDLHVPLYHNYVAEATISHNCMLPSFRFLGCGPTSYQASQMHEAVRTELLDWKRRDDIRRPIHKYVKKIVDRPWPRIEFTNGSTMEFMSGDQQGQKILTWSGDVVVVDQAESFDDLERLLENLGTRTRGIVQDRERLGKLILLANAEYHPALWERFDMGLKDIDGSMPEHYLSILLTTYDNPYLSKNQVDAFERRIVDPERRRQLLLSERPIPRGKEFTPALLEPAQAPSMDENMAHQLREGTVGYRMQTMRRAGTWLWEVPYNEFGEYIVVGDPGQNCPPYRNSPCIVTFDVTDFPDRPAHLAAFWWGDGKGSYWPFIYKFEEYCQIYRPRAKGFDATGVQKGFDELCFQQRGIIVEGLNMQKWKMQMIVTLKLLLGKELLRMPKDIQGIWMQLAGWHMPDKKLRQDVASTLFMAAFLINRLYLAGGRPDGDESDTMDGGEEEDRYTATRLLRQNRHERTKR